MILLIKNADIYTPAPIGKQDVLVVNDKVERIAPSIDLSDAALAALGDVTVVDAAGKRLIPGLIDQHVHITGGGGEASFKSRAPEIRLEDIVEAGVTTIVGLLGTDSRTRSVRNVVAKAKALNEEGVTAYCLTGSYEFPSPTLTGSVADDIVFIKEVIGCKIAISDHRSTDISKAELARLACQVRLASLESGKVGEVHMHMGNGKKGLSDIFAILEENDIPIKHFRPTHVGKIIPDAIRFANMGGYIDFTSGDPKETARKMAETIDKVPFDRVTLSSDSNGSMPKWNEKNEVIGIDVARMTTLYACVRSLVEDHGWPLEKALAPVTETVARALEIYPQKGCIAPGSDADLILLNDDLSFDTLWAKGRVMMENGKVTAHGYYSC